MSDDIQHRAFWVELSEMFTENELKMALRHKPTKRWAERQLKQHGTLVGWNGIVKTYRKFMSLKNK